MFSSTEQEWEGVGAEVLPNFGYETAERKTDTKVFPYILFVMVGFHILLQFHVTLLTFPTASDSSH